MDATEPDTLAKARAGDAEAIGRIVAAHQAAVRRYVARLAPDPVTADDLAQDVFVAAIQSLDRIDPAIGILPYLLGIARNTVRLAWRERARSPASHAEQVLEMLVAGSPEKEYTDRPDNRLEALEDCIRRLAPKALDVLLRHYRDEQRCDEIGERIGQRASTVRSILTRTRQALRECLKGKIGEAATP